MKEKLNKAKEWIKENKKRSAGILVAFLLIIGAAAIGIVGVTSVNGSKDADKAATAEKDTSKKTVKKSSDSKKTSKSDKKEDEKATDEEKKADDAKAENDSAAADEKQTVENNAASSTSNAGTSNQTASSNSSGSGGGSGQESSHTHSYTIPVYGTEQKWVVDQATWTETVNEPVYETVERCICNGCGADITADPGTHMKENMMAGNYSCGAWHSEWIQVQTGTNTYTITHPEQGHWESYSVVTGYRCSCGYAQ